MGVLIVIEGIENSGKTTLAKSLKAHLGKLNKDVVVLNEKEYILNALSSESVIGHSKNPAQRLLMVLAARAALIPIIKQHLAIHNRIVILDGWSPSTLANETQLFPEEWVIGADRIARQGLRAHLVLWLDISEDTAFERSKTANRSEKFDIDDAIIVIAKYAKQYEVDQRDLKIWRRINAEAPASEVLEESINRMAVLIATGSLNFSLN